MTERPGPFSLAGLRDALLAGREPPALRVLSVRPSYRWMVVGSVCIGSFMGQVDASITQLLLPRLEEAFDAKLSAVSLVAVAYLVTMAALLPIFGRLADMVGRKLLYAGGFLVFVAGSALCGFAGGLGELVVFRILQGIGAGLLMANSVAIVVSAAGPERRGRALGIQAAAQAVGLSVGPALGGLVLDTLDWRWVFWINVPVGLVGAAIGWMVIPPTQGPRTGGGFDRNGALILVPALAVLMAAINQAQAWGLLSPAFLGALAGAGLLFALFVRIERRAPVPLVELGLFRSLPFTAGAIAGLLAYAMLFGVFFLMPFVFIRGHGDTALEAGLRLCIVPVAIGMVAPFSGALSDRLGPRLPTVAGMSVAACALALLAVSLGTGLGGPFLVMACLAGVGAGQGLFSSPNNSAIMGGAPARLTGAAGGLVNVARASGTSIGIAAASALLAARLVTAGGSGGTRDVAPAVLSAAAADVVLMLAAFAAAAAIVSALGVKRGARQPR